MFKLEVTNEIGMVRDLVTQGYCPVECSIGGESIVDSLEMDHHGVLSHLEGVAVRAYRDHYGSRSSDPRFVVVGTVDADAAFAIASLAGLIPHPSKEVNGPPPVQRAWKADLTTLAGLVNLIDTDPIGVDLAAHPEGPKLLLWNSMFGGGRDALQGSAGVDGWRRITTAPPFAVGPLLAAVKETEGTRRAAALRDWGERGSTLGRVGVLTHSRAWGFDVWYGRDPSASPDSPAGWERPVVIALVEAMGGITIGCPNKAVAEALFGEGGLKNVFPKLSPEGWGGREAIGGSPRGLKMSEGDLQAAALKISELINR